MTNESHIVPVSSPHLQAPITTRRYVERIAIAGNVLERVTSSPLTWPCFAVPLQLVRFGEVVPGSQDLDGEDGGWCLTVSLSASAPRSRRPLGDLQHKSNERSRGHHA